MIVAESDSEPAKLSMDSMYTLLSESESGSELLTTFETGSH